MRYAMSALLLLAIPCAAYADLDIASTSRVYASGQPLVVFGQAEPGEELIIRMTGPDSTITKFDQITTNPDGTFQYTVLVWPEATVSFPYGTYTIEILSAAQEGLSRTLDVRFAQTAELVETPVSRTINILIFAPETSAVNNTLRVFVQTTSDGLLVGNNPEQLLGNNPEQLLGTTHVHLPDGTVHDISDSFNTLHQGLFYADYVPHTEGTYVFHVVAFSQGTISHGSAATTVLSQDIGGISDQIILLNEVLAATSAELDGLKAEVAEFKDTLQQASGNINASVGSMSASVTNIEGASSQLNSLFFPVIAIMGVLVATQIAILARSRH